MGRLTIQISHKAQRNTHTIIFFKLITFQTVEIRGTPIKL